MELMNYLQTYKDAICYEASGMLPDKNAAEKDSNSEDETLKAEEIWPVSESGPTKGQLIPTLDTHGNVVVDPAGNILKE